jgi:hypothetical protein
MALDDHRPDEVCINYAPPGRWVQRRDLRVVVFNSTAVFFDNRSKKVFVFESTHPYEALELAESRICTYLYRTESNAATRARLFPGIDD